MTHQGILYPGVVCVTDKFYNNSGCCCNIYLYLKLIVIVSNATEHMLHAVPNLLIHLITCCKFSMCFDKYLY